MTTINDISDLVQVLKDRPDWLAAVRNMIVGEELLSLPQQLAQFIKATEENFRLVNRRFNRLEGKVATWKVVTTSAGFAPALWCEWSTISG